MYTSLKTIPFIFKNVNVNEFFLNKYKYEYKRIKFLSARTSEHC